MSITVSTLAPFASFIAARTTVTPNYNQLKRNIRSFFPTSGHRFRLSTLPLPAYPGLTTVYALHLREQRPVTWAGTNPVTDQLNHIVAYFAFADFLLIYVSDSDLKAEMHDALFAKQIVGWAPVDERVLVNAFVTGNALRTLWLGGAHRAATIRPRSKILSGTDLSDAIDPFADSTFVAGAVRSAKAGVSLKRSGVWFGPKRDWNSMCDTALAVLTDLHANQANIATLSASVHNGLAQSITDFTGVGPAYEVEWADPETLKGKSRSNNLANLRALYDIEINTSIAPVPAKNVSLNVTHVPSGTSASLMLEPDFDGTQLVIKFSGAVPQVISEFVNSVAADTEIIRIYYDSWHTLANATLTLARVQDRPITLDFLDFSPGPAYRVDQEKPPGKKVVLNNIFTAADVSLFKWVFKEGLSQLGLPLPQSGRCWLYCDDGAGEVADFIHLALPSGSNPLPKITLIHIKGANSRKPSRRISASAYEVVTAQAMKNLRRMISADMHTAILNTVTKHGANRVWDQPWALGLASSAAVGNAMLAALTSIRANCAYEVIIVQPHVLQSKYLKLSGGHSMDTGAVQLRSLLFGAQAMTQAAGATFRVVCDER